MKKALRYIGIGILLLTAVLQSKAQNYVNKQVELPVTIDHGDTIPLVHLREVYIFNRPTFTSRRKEKEYWRTVRDVKRTLPLAREIRNIIIETYEYIQTLPTEKARNEHLNKVEKGLKAQYTPIVTKLNYRQGKLLIKLVDRECEQTSYELIKVFMGNFKAGFYQTFASLFGASLKKEYNPEVDDATIEEIIFLVENGLV